MPITGINIVLDQCLLVSGMYEGRSKSS